MQSICDTSKLDYASSVRASVVSRMMLLSLEWSDIKQNLHAIANSQQRLTLARSPGDRLRLSWCSTESTSWVRRQLHEKYARSHFRFALFTLPCVNHYYYGSSFSNCSRQIHFMFCLFNRRMASLQSNCYLWADCFVKTCRSSESNKLSVISCRDRRDRDDSIPEGSSSTEISSSPRRWTKRELWSCACVTSIPVLLQYCYSICIRLHCLNNGFSNLTPSKGKCLAA